MNGIIVSAVLMQVLIDDSHILVLGGCGGPNMVSFL